jgi:hypothetical protein
LLTLRDKPSATLQIKRFLQNSALTDGNATDTFGRKGVPSCLSLTIEWFASSTLAETAFDEITPRWSRSVDRRWHFDAQRPLLACGLPIQVSDLNGVERRLFVKVDCLSECRTPAPF